MAFQSTLPDISQKPKATHKLFFAVMPQVHAAQQIAALAATLRNTHGLHDTLIDVAQLHLSLFPVGQFVGLPEHVVHGASCIADRIILESFKVRFDVATGFRNRSRVSGQYPFALCQSKPCYDLANLHQGFADYFRDRGIMVPQAFTPHVTMLYSDTLAPKLAVEPIEWVVDEFVLLLRHIGQHLPYSILGRWPLY